MLTLPHDDPDRLPMTDNEPRASRRIDLLDVARGVALVAMAVYHFTWDLEFFGYAEPGLTAQGGWKLFARCIASSFLILVGVSLVLAHRAGLRWRPFLIRLAMVAGAAAAISAVTYFAFPDGFIFFGILHQIALASVLGLLFLRVPVVVTAAVAVAVVALPFYVRLPIFDHPALWWVGLSTFSPRSNDYVPLFPWFGAVLAGVVLARLAISQGAADRLAGVSAGRWAIPLRIAGRHSLLFYLVHQPVLIAAVWVASQVIAPPPQAPGAAFRKSCERTCQQTRDAAFCTRYCQCVFDELEARGGAAKLAGGPQDDTTRAKVGEVVSLCSVAAETSESNDAPAP